MNEWCSSSSYCLFLLAIFHDPFLLIRRPILRVSLSVNSSIPAMASLSSVCSSSSSSSSSAAAAAMDFREALPAFRPISRPLLGYPYNHPSASLRLLQQSRARAFSKYVGRIGAKQQKASAALNVRDRESASSTALEAPDADSAAAASGGERQQEVLPEPASSASSASSAAAADRGLTDGSIKKLDDTAVKLGPPQSAETKDASITLFPDGFLDDISIKSLDWVSIVPNHMLPPGDRLIFNHSGEEVMLCWFQDKIYALSNTSPAVRKRLSDAEITEDGVIVCPYTQSRFDIRTGALLDWLPNESLLVKLWTPPISDLTVYPVKVSPQHIYIDTQPSMVGGYFALAEFTGNRISTDPNYEKSIIWESLEEDMRFGFTPDNEIVNGRAAMLGFLALILMEIHTGEGLLKLSGALDWIYQNLPVNFPLLRY